MLPEPSVAKTIPPEYVGPWYGTPGILKFQRGAPVRASFAWIVSPKKSFQYTLPAATTTVVNERNANPTDESTRHLSAPVASSRANNVTSAKLFVTNTTYTLPYPTAGVPAVPKPSRFWPSFLDQRIDPVPRSKAVKMPSGEVTNTVCPWMTEPVH